MWLLGVLHHCLSECQSPHEIPNRVKIAVPLDGLFDTQVGIYFLRYGTTTGDFLQDPPVAEPQLFEDQNTIGSQ